MPNTQRTVPAPSPVPLSAVFLPNRVLSVVLNDDEDVEWTWTSTLDGVSYVSGYSVVKRAFLRSGDGTTGAAPAA
jgi:hypothetical protein